MSAGSFGNTGKAKKLLLKQRKEQKQAQILNFLFTNVKNML